MRSGGTTTSRGSGVWSWPIGGMAGVAAAVALIVAVGGVVGFLSGCSGGSEPTPSVTWTPVYQYPTPTPTPTPTDPAALPPERPAAMDTTDTAGAEAVARYFLDLYTYAYATGDLTEWQALSHPECVFCASVVTKVEEQVAAGHHNEGSGITVDDIDVVEINATRFAVDALVTQGPSRELDTDGVVISERSESQQVALVFALTVDGGWIVREVDANTPASSS